MGINRQVRRHGAGAEEPRPAPVVYSEVVLRFKPSGNERTETEQAELCKVHRRVTVLMSGGLIHVHDFTDKTSYVYNWADVRSIELVESRVDQAAGLVQ